MKLEGVHHVTAITADAPRNVEFYAGTLGLRLVKKTVNQDDPTVYHLFYADEGGDPGRLTFVDPEGLRHELAVVATTDEPLTADHPEVPAELALQGFDGVRAFAADPERSRELLEQTLEFEPRAEDAWE